MNFRLIALIGVSSALTGCYYDKESELYPSACSTPAVVSYLEHIQPMIQANCAISGCHVQSGGGPGLMGEYASLKQFIDNGKFANRVLTEKNMPPTGGLNDCQLELIDKWLLAGAPEN